MKPALYLLVAATLFAGCSPTIQTIKFPKKPNEIFANNNLKAFFKTNQK